MSAWELYTQLFSRNWRCRRFARSLSLGCSEKIRKKGVVMTSERWSSWSIQIPQFLMLWWLAMEAGSTAMTQRPRDRVPNGSMLALPDPRMPDRANPPTNLWYPFFLKTLAWSTCTGFPLNRHSTRNTIVVYWFPTQPNMPFKKRWKCIFHWRGRAWLTVWDRVKIPPYTHRLMHRKRVTCEQHDSYFCLMTIKHIIPKTAEVTHSDGQSGGGIVWAIELLYNSVKTGSQLVGDQMS